MRRFIICLLESYLDFNDKYEIRTETNYMECGSHSTNIRLVPKGNKAKDELATCHFIVLVAIVFIAIVEKILF